MAHLTKPLLYNIEDSNIALLGSDLEKRVRENAGDNESAWESAGIEPGLQIWRIESFQVVEWPKARYGTFYDGDSYIVLHTYRKTPESDALSYDLHFWLGKNTSQDEAGTAAYKTVELDDNLKGRPVQYREAQGYESERFLSYFPRFISLRGGVATGFQHVSEPPPLDIKKLYLFSLSHAPARSVLVREVPAEAAGLVNHDVFVLDKGEQVWQFNTMASAGVERFKAAEFVRSIVHGRKQCVVTVYEEGAAGAGVFLSEFGVENTKIPQHNNNEDIPVDQEPLALFRISDSSGKVTFAKVERPSFSSLSSDDAFLLDDSANTAFPAVYAWLGEFSSLTERRLTVQYAQAYLHNKGHSKRTVSVPLIRMVEGAETAEFMDALPVE